MRPGVLLDLDGTLIDTAPAILISFNAAFDEIGLETPPEQALRATIGQGLFDVFRQFYPDLSRVDVERAIAAFRDCYDGEARDKYRVFEGVGQALELLKREGFALAVVTSKPASFAHRLIDRAGLGDYVDRIMGTGLDERGWRSGKRRLVQKAPRLLGMGPAFILGDRATDIEAGKAAGLTTIAAAWGYGSHAELEGANPDVIVDTPAKFVAWTIKAVDQRQVA